MFENVLQTIIDSFDLGFMVAVNVLTYTIIKFHDEINGAKKVPMWTKRIYLVGSIVLIGGILYCLQDEPSVTKLLYSAIAAPVFWSWVLKPICKKLGVDYKKIDNVM